MILLECIQYLGVCWYTDSCEIVVFNFSNIKSTTSIRKSGAGWCLL